MKILLTCATGFIGRHVMQRLQEYGINTIVAGRTLPKDCSRSEFIRADLIDCCDFDGLISEAGATHLMHLAWYAEHGKYWTSSLNLQWINSTVRLVESFCRAGGERVILAGTCAEYDWAYGYCREELTPLNPSTFYGKAKYSTCLLSAAICAEHNVSCSWGRVFLPYGKGEDRRRLIPSLIEVFQGKRRPFGVNAKAYRDFLNAEDVAEGFIKLSQAESAGVYNICSGRPVQIGELVRQIAASLKANPDTVLNLATERLGEPSMLIGDNAKLRSIGWQQAHTLEVDILQKIQSISNPEA